MENPVQAGPQTSNTGRTIAIVAIVFVVLMCCCAVIVIAALAIMGPMVGNTFSSINRDIEMTAMPGFPTMSPDMTMPSISPDATLPSLSDVIPSGGNGDDSQRASAWAFVIVQTATDGCSFNPKASATTIKVTQEANTDGVWVEEWTVTCDSESKNTYTVTFTPGANGSTDIKVK